MQLLTSLRAKFEWCGVLWCRVQGMMSRCAGTPPVLQGWEDALRALEARGALGALCALDTTCSLSHAPTSKFRPARRRCL